MYVYMTVREGKALAAEKEEAAGGGSRECVNYIFLKPLHICNEHIAVRNL